MRARNKDAIRDACTRALSHEVPSRRSPKRILERLAALTPEDARADSYGEGELLASFEREIAAMLGKEAAVFLPSGTMAQQIALRIWSERKRISTVAFHPTCHLELHEERGYSRLHGLDAKLVGARSALMTTTDLERVAEPVAALLVELPQREIGGQLPSWADLVALVELAKLRGMAVHLDGARLWETTVFYDRSLADVAALFDSVYVSVYKVLGGIAGCLLAGTLDFVREARVWQRRHGGTLVTEWPLVLAAKAGLAERLPKIPSYVAKARSLAARLAKIEGLEIVPEVPPTNMFHVHVEGDMARLEDAALDIAEKEGVWMFGKLAPTDSPRRHRVELSCGDATLELHDEEIARLFLDLMTRARDVDPAPRELG